MIKYQYAENCSGNTVHINSIEKNDRHADKYICIDCKQELIPKLGEIKVHHFSHKSNSYNCSKETYLHELGKRMFYETYTHCIENNEPFYIVTSMFNTFSTVCKYYRLFKTKYCINNGINKYDLTQNFKVIEYEKTQDNFRPDLTLKNNFGEKIFVEIAVTHHCEKEKIESKNKIIEISIKDESDISIITGKSISEENNCTILYNFDNFYVFVEPICPDNSLSDYSIVLKDGKQHNVRTVKRELCKFINENKDHIKNVSLINKPIPVMPTNNFNLRGPRIDYIESKMNRKNIRSNSKLKKRRKK